MKKPEIIWTDYLKYRSELRGYDRSKIEEIVLYSNERYFDVATGRMVVVGKHNERLVIIPYEATGENVTPVTIHAITRQQIRYRIKTGRLSYGKTQNGVFR